MSMLNPYKSQNELGNSLVSFLNAKKEIGGESRMIYRPSFRLITGNTNAAILLSQILFYFKLKNFKPFFKFIKPCDHALYRPGDSWTEELAWSYDEFNTALSKLGTKVTAGTSKTEVFNRSKVIYWTDSNRVTWYMVNIANLAKEIVSLYGVDRGADSGLSFYLNDLNSLITHQLDDAELPYYIESPENQTNNHSDTCVGGIIGVDADGGMPSASVTVKGINEILESKSREPVVGNIIEHPMVKFVMETTSLYHLDSKLVKMFVRSVKADHIDGTKIFYSCLLGMWDKVPRFEEFARERVIELRGLQMRVEPINILKNLTKVADTPTDEKYKMPGFWLWCEQNPEPTCSDAPVYVWGPPLPEEE